MSNEQGPTCEELKQRLAEAEAAHSALAATEAQAFHIKQVLLAIRKVNRLIVAATDPLQLIEQACATLIETMGYHNAWIALVDDTGTAVSATTFAGFGNTFSNLDKMLKAGEYPDCLRRALATDTVVVVQDPRQECARCPLTEEYGGRAGLSHRLHHHGITYGTLTVSVPTAYAFDEEEQSLFAEISGDLSFGLHKIKAANHLRESRAMLARTERIAHIGSWEWEIAGDRVYWSDELFRIFQRDPAAGAPSFSEQEQLYHHEDMARLRRAVESCQKFGIPYTLELRAIRADGHIRHCLAHGQARRDDHGHIHRLVGSLQDISERRQAEEALRMEHQRLSFIIEGSGLGTWVWNIQTNETVLNHNFAAMVGSTLAELSPYSFATWERLVHSEDLQRATQLLARCVNGEQPEYECEFRMRHKQGHWIWVLARGRVMSRDGDGKPLSMFGTHTDITRLKQAEETLRAREQYMQTILQTSADGFWVLDGQGAFIEVNEAYLAMTGYSRHELLGLRIGDVDAIETTAETSARHHRILTNGAELFESRHRRKDGSTFPVEVSTTWLNQDGGRFVCFGRDLSEREQREQRLTLLGQMLDAAPASITIHDATGRFLFANKMTAALHGYDDENDFYAINLHDLDVPECRALLEQRLHIITEQEEAKFEVAHFRKDGTSFPLEVLTKIIQWEGQPAILSIATDITERKRTEQALRESDERNRLLSDLTMEGIVLHCNGVARDMNASMARMLDYSREELLQRNFLPFFHPDDLLLIRENIAKDYAAPYIVRMKRRNGDFFHVEIESYNFQRSEETWRVSALRDVSERVRMQEELRRSEQHLQQIFEILPIGLWLADKHGTLLRGNPMGIQIWGAEPKVPVTEYGLFKAWRLPSREPVQPDEWALVKTIRTGATIVDELLEIEAFDGKRKTILNYTAPVLDDNGEVDGAIVVNLDISDRKTLENQLLQAHKMESVGRLAGGVAHDFNNMLGVIIGYAEMALEEVAEHQPIHRPLLGIRQAAQRSADLTRQLLAFARKQTVAPKVLDLNDTVTGMLSMLRRLIGENIDLAWLPGEHLWPVKMDPAQVDQVLANLCVNGRDAINGPGRITIETGNIILDPAYCSRNTGFLPGEYVLLAVSDNGCGMDRETLTHLFEPFFTTKERGKGTGLGLAMIYGIAKQNHGFINVYSEPGQGTTFKIYLPHHAGDTAPLEEHSVKEPATGRETILLVEDEPMILEMTVTMLQRLGYNILPAATPDQAVALAREYAAEIHLLITDVVMPTMNGRELALTIQSLCPDLKLLFMSGYTANVIAHHGVLDAGVHFMQKPFSRQDLATKVREALEAVGDDDGKG